MRLDVLGKPALHIVTWQAHTGAECPGHSTSNSSAGAGACSMHLTASALLHWSQRTSNCALHDSRKVVRELLLGWSVNVCHCAVIDGMFDLPAAFTAASNPSSHALLSPCCADASSVLAASMHLFKLLRSLSTPTPNACGYCWKDPVLMLCVCSSCSTLADDWHKSCHRWLMNARLKCGHCS